jgi:hypothetical protein
MLPAMLLMSRRSRANAVATRIVGAEFSRGRSLSRAHQAPLSMLLSIRKI